jgi:hypothetical protein
MKGILNKIPTRCSKSSLFYFVFALHVSGATFTHHQEPQLYKRVWCNCINRLCSWAKCVTHKKRRKINSICCILLEFYSLTHDARKHATQKWKVYVYFLRPALDLHCLCLLSAAWAYFSPYCRSAKCTVLLYWVTDKLCLSVDCCLVLVFLTWICLTRGWYSL